MFDHKTGNNEHRQCKFPLQFLILSMVKGEFNYASELDASTTIVERFMQRA